MMVQIFLSVSFHCDYDVKNRDKIHSHHSVQKIHLKFKVGVFHSLFAQNSPRFLTVFFTAAQQQKHCL